MRIPYTEPSDLGRAIRRTRLVRIGLWCALVALVLATAFAARRPHQAVQPLLAPNAGGVVVLDLSASITSDTYARIHQSLAQLVARGGRYGLVVFSNTAYEAYPPGLPASALEPLVRYFAVPTPAPGEQPSFPANPWGAGGFTSGTEISTGLDLARRIELANGVRRPAVVLISDLQDDPNDLQRLTAVLEEYQVAKARLRIIALNADPSDLARFRGLIGTASSIIPAGLPGQSPLPREHASFPLGLVLLALAGAALLAALALWSARLRWAAGTGEAAG
ncbi:MAG TPA: vWA domain-containing protein [Gaiellaceae bacterium]|nr:vWA domain-containing protein [Gaiellaceae bacterium]